MNAELVENYKSTAGRAPRTRFPSPDWDVWELCDELPFTTCVLLFCNIEPSSVTVSQLSRDDPELSYFWTIYDAAANGISNGKLPSRRSPTPS